MVTRHEDLSQFRYHIGATPRPLAADEPCPLLFRDLGPVATRRFLQGELSRLAGPSSPVLYVRSVEYREPYCDYERIGRLVFLCPKRYCPWYSGVPTVFVASADHVVDADTVGFVPGHVSLDDAASRLAGVPNTTALRELFGGREYDELRLETAARLKQLEAELAQVECLAEPLRRRLQSGTPAVIERVRNWMGAVGITEHDLCAAWHHVPRGRRDLLRGVLQSEELP